MEDKLAEYAKLIVRTGVNVQKGQILVVRCSVECADFARRVAKEAYDAGAKETVLLWTDDALDRMKFLQADDSIFDEMPAWLKTFYYEYADKKAALIAIHSSDPENFKGVNPDRIKRSTMSRGKELKRYMEMQTSYQFPWNVASVPSAAWAKKVFPGKNAGEAEVMLWEAIFAAVRVTGDGKAEERWHEHSANLKKRAKVLNDNNFAKLVYKNSLGTDLTVELAEKHTWICGDKIAGTGVSFFANMPTEETFTIPKKTGINGTICSSIPLALDGNLVTDIRFTVKDGKIIDAKASEGQETLLQKLDVDEGARYFGEVALVPYKSPISDTGILFYNTLFDENASCHFAFGKAYPAFTDANTAPPEELKKRGMNDSMIHVDFMVGTADLSITGITTDGREVPVFVNGNFAF